MKKLLSLAVIAAAMLVITGCETCYGCGGEEKADEVCPAPAETK